MTVQTLKWTGSTDGNLLLLDQRRLPAETVNLTCATPADLHHAIKTLAVRGAPAIGVAAAYGMVLALKELDPATELPTVLEHLDNAARYLSSARPTGANLAWAVNRITDRTRRFLAEHCTADARAIAEFVLDQARTIHAEDADICRTIGRIGCDLIKPDSAILTHCNAGALATAGIGTALAPIYTAHERGVGCSVYVDETRPLLQGARLTAWELKQAGINVTLICDNMAGWLMKQNKISAVITGADRIAANGDTANKIGTSALAVLARRYNVPFYVAAPAGTFDLSLKSGAEIPIEQRDASEVTAFAGVRTAPEDIEVCNPAFDVTDAGDITAIITEKGLIEKPDAEKIAAVFAGRDSAP